MSTMSTMYNTVHLFTSTCPSQKVPYHFARVRGTIQGRCFLQNEVVVEHGSMTLSHRASACDSDENFWIKSFKTFQLFQVVMIFGENHKRTIYKNKNNKHFQFASFLTLCSSLAPCRVQCETYCTSVIACSGTSPAAWAKTELAESSPTVDSNEVRQFFSFRIR